MRLSICIVFVLVGSALSSIACIETDKTTLTEGTRCYTPCKSGAVIKGEYRACSDEGLMQVCLGATECIDGWCVLASSNPAPEPAPNPPPKPAEDDNDTEEDSSGQDEDSSEQERQETNANGSCIDDCGCADHGTCIDGQCASQCETDADCQEEGEGCHRKVCRQECTSTSQDEDQAKTCPVDTTCEIGADGINGYCMPNCAPPVDDTVHKCLNSTGGDVPPYELVGDDIAEGFIHFNANTITTSFTLINNTQCVLDFAVRRKGHSEYTDEGIKKVEENALHWISIESGGNASEGGSELVIEQVAADGGEAVITISNVENEEIANWRGIIEVGTKAEVRGDDLGSVDLSLSFSSGVDGQWAGKMYYFGNFGTDKLSEWRDAGFTEDALRDVGNAFIKRWGVMRRGAISLDNFMAAVSSTQNESWKWPTVQAKCPAGGCYPFANPDENPDDGIEEYSDDLDSSPIPTGMVELPIAMNVRASEEGDNLFEGKIISNETLQYAGDPNISFTLAASADTCEQKGKVCLNIVTETSADIVVGGRYMSDKQGRCTGEGFNKMKIPWLLYDFKGLTDVEEGVRFYYECRDTMQPFDKDSPLLPEGLRYSDINQVYAGSNPLPDAQCIKRTLNLVDGALFNKDIMFLIFEEKFEITMEGVNEPEDFSGYGFMMLRRKPMGLDDEDYAGSAQADYRTPPGGKLRVECSENILNKAGFDELSIENADDLAKIMIDSTASELTEDQIVDSEEIFYLCWETGEFGGGAYEDVAEEEDAEEEDDPLTPETARWCPLSSNVTFFYLVDDGLDPANNDCNSAAFERVEVDPYERDPDSDSSEKVIDKWVVETQGGCDEVLQTWIDIGKVVIKPKYQCADETVSQKLCDGDEYDRRKGKDFYGGEAAAEGQFKSDIRRAIHNAFRYKTAFRSRSGKNIGFTPEVCSGTHGTVPYCYDPAAIEEIQQRVDCSLSIYAEHGDSIANKDNLKSYLTENFTSACIYEKQSENEDPEIAAEMCRRPTYQQDGLEALFAELLIMLGDDAYTTSFASRFDLAGMGKATFEGTLFEGEKIGINLSGAAGYEMHSLHQAVQYYQLALDRFYSLMPAMYRSLQDDGPNSFISAGTVTNYFDRLIRASTQKARTWAEISKRYQSFNQPDLARRVIERAYTATYLESVLITRMMHNVTDISKASEVAQIMYIVEQAQLRYKASLLEMRDINESITDDVNYFGYPPEYIPFPAVDQGDFAEGNINAFDKLRDSAMAKLEVAAAKEQLAIASSCNYEVDSASFQSELVTIRNTYEADLSELCGSFEGEDGYIYPAITQYAHLHEKSRSLQNPCGLMGNGEIVEAIFKVNRAAREADLVLQRRRNKVQEIHNEKERIQDVCDELIDLRKFTWKMETGKMALNGIIESGDAVAEAIERSADTVQWTSEMAKCTVGLSTDCPTAAVSVSVGLGAKIGENIAKTAWDLTKMGMRRGIEAMERAKTEYEINTQCDLASIDANATMKNLAMEVLEIDIELMIATEQMELASSVLAKLVNKAKRLEVELGEAEQQAINIEAARNDPNTRIYKNDAIINADKTFWSAVKDAYKATKVYEYYTSTSYAHLIDLFLVRMVSAGDYNLENYLRELDSAFYEFEEQFGNPDPRLSIISLRDDIFDIPRYLDSTGVALSAGERAELFTDELLNPKWLDGNGYVRIPFSTKLEEVSPLTRNHKIFYMEAEIQGDDVGDAIGRLYLTQSGTGTIRSVEGNKMYYSFPERIAVVDTFFNGEKEIDSNSIYSTIYRNDRFIDRPFANSEWELVFNGMDESVNKDINLSTVTDLRLYIYYTDFTALP
ncbi:MAG: hypothetical protein GY847_34655 [Proteobacteria bacterium]|nr:hypothetical protein [Pseudomonadota bacterium]